MSCRLYLVANYMTENVVRVIVLAYAVLSTSSLVCENQVSVSLFLSSLSSF